MQNRGNRVRYLIILMMLIGGSSWASSAADAQRVFQQLKSANGWAIQSGPKLYIDAGGYRDAYGNGSNVHISRGMLRYLRNNAELAMVLGHELGHFTSGGSTSYQREYNADMKGAQYASRAGYSICSGAEALRRFHDGDSDTHPASDKRVRRLGC